VEHLVSLRCVVCAICAVPYASSEAEVSDISARPGSWRATAWGKPAVNRLRIERARPIASNWRPDQPSAAPYRSASSSASRPSACQQWRAGVLGKQRSHSKRRFQPGARVLAALITCSGAPPLSPRQEWPLPYNVKESQIAHCRPRVWPPFQPAAGRPDIAQSSCCRPQKLRETKISYSHIGGVLKTYVRSKPRCVQIH
jgi:hypothetical protein